MDLQHDNRRLDRLVGPLELPGIGNRRDAEAGIHGRPAHDLGEARLVIHDEEMFPGHVLSLHLIQRFS